MNHIKNILIIVGQPELVASVIAKIKSNNEVIDFNTITAMPDGVINKRDWAIHNWGSINAYDTYLEADNKISFYTGVSTPSIALKNLSLMYPELRFIIDFASDKLGYNVGQYIFENGKIINSHLPDGGTLEAFKKAVEVRNDDYYLTEYIVNLNDDAIKGNNLLESLIPMVHELGYLAAYPKPVLERLKNLALSDEQYERVILIDNLLTK